MSPATPFSYCFTKKIKDYTDFGVFVEKKCGGMNLQKRVGKFGYP